MLQPSLVVLEVVSAFQSIPAVITELGGNPSNIYGHNYYAGLENSLARTLYEQTAPSVIVAYKDLLGGNWDQSTRWKHRIDIYLRPRNAAVDIGCLSPPDLFQLMFHSPLGAPPSPLTGHWSAGIGIRYQSLYAGSMQLMDTPTMMHRQDEAGTDLFQISCVWPEYGDQ